MADRTSYHGFPVADSLPRLHEAAMEDDQSLLRRTLRLQPDVNVYWDGEMALHVACRLGHDAIASTLIDNGACVTARLMYRPVLPLGVAIENGFTTTARLLVDKGKFLQYSQGQEYGAEALNVTAAAGNNEIHSYLLKQGCIDINHWSGRGWNPLRTAVNYGRKRMVRELLEAGADPQPGCPVQLAIYRHHTSIVQLLIEHKADVNTFSEKYGGYCIHLAVEADQIETVRMVLKANCDLSVLSREGKTSLYLAAELGYPDIVHELLMAGAAPNLGMPATGDGPFVAAMTMPVQALYINPNKPIKQITLILIQAGVNVDLKNLEGVSPFALAVERGLYQVAMLLMAADCDVQLPKTREKQLTGQIGRAEEVDMEFVKCYSAMVQEVFTLSRLCRKLLRSSLHVQPIQRAIDSLPLPRALKDFLLLPELQHASQATDLQRCI